MTHSLDLENDFQRATALRDDGDLVAARALLERLSDEYPSSFAVWLVLGDIQWSQLDYEAAEVSFSVAIALQPRSEIASGSMFHVLKHLGRVNDAFAEVRRFLALRPESREYELLREELDENDFV